MSKISAVYKFTNTVTKDFYIGSHKNIKRSLANHKYQSVWISIPNDQMYQDIQKYGIDKFELEILAEVEPEQLKETKQKFIETLKPTYNSNRVNGWDIERRKEYNKEYIKEYNKQLCSYNGETLTLCALSMRFQRSGVEHPTIEAKRYLIGGNDD